MLCSLLVWVLWSTYMYVYAIAIFSHQLSSLGICPFFVENVSSLQLSALRLVRAVSSAFCLCVIRARSLLICLLPSQIFSRYEKHRELILEDIFASLARLPTTKRNLRNFKYVNIAPIQV